MKGKKSKSSSSGSVGDVDEGFLAKIMDAKGSFGISIETLLPDKGAMQNKIESKLHHYQKVLDDTDDFNKLGSDPNLDGILSEDFKKLRSKLEQINDIIKTTPTPSNDEKENERKKKDILLTIGCLFMHALMFQCKYDDGMGWLVLHKIEDERIKTEEEIESIARKIIGIDQKLTFGSWFTNPRSNFNDWVRRKGLRTRLNELTAFNVLERKKDFYVDCLLYDNLIGHFNSEMDGRPGFIKKEESLGRLLKECNGLFSTLTEKAFNEINEINEINGCEMEFSQQESMDGQPEESNEISASGFERMVGLFEKIDLDNPAGSAENLYDNYCKDGQWCDSGREIGTAQDGFTTPLNVQERSTSSIVGKSPRTCSQSSEPFVIRRHNGRRSSSSSSSSSSSRMVITNRKAMQSRRAMKR